MLGVDFNIVQGLLERSLRIDVSPNVSKTKREGSHNLFLQNCNLPALASLDECLCVSEKFPRLKF